MDDFLDIHKEGLKFGFWREEHTDSVIKAIESQYKTEVLMKYYISEIYFSGKILVKWEERFSQLTEEQVNERYGRK
jgi:hypothetical protein